MNCAHVFDSKIKVKSLDHHLHPRFMPRIEQPNANIKRIKRRTRTTQKRHRKKKLEKKGQTGHVVNVSLFIYYSVYCSGVVVCECNVCYLFNVHKHWTISHSPWKILSTHFRQILLLCLLHIFRMSVYTIHQCRNHCHEWQ